MIEVEDLLDSPCSSSTIVEAFGRAERPRACTQKAGCRGSGRVDVRCAPDSGVKADVAGLARWATFDNAQRGELERSSKKASYFGNALDQFRNIGNKLHNSVPKGGEDSFVPFTHCLFHETLPS